MICFSSQQKLAHTAYKPRPPQAMHASICYHAFLPLSKEAHVCAAPLASERGEETLGPSPAVSFDSQYHHPPDT